MIKKAAFAAFFVLFYREKQPITILLAYSCYSHKKYFNHF
ncbi:putative lipoprotein [Colwellia psychrerythraea 34H]|uniref:Putative lipoprotein n=1 Tax=Colwellia psychrerythraea (strain 34H / ATCC BAA-681) TaxID=167879 RepID=Q482S9_COLP3|nr:putative lipoprotein [Colwellia psychrerythraea 34H]